jgi:hypothetical protein
MSVRLITRSAKLPELSFFRFAVSLNLFGLQSCAGKLVFEQKKKRTNTAGFVAFFYDHLGQ